eukprot:Protomagalhaensia_sp_Gyna_25__5787@NODE_849_length_2511_cov_19_475324_g670_i0_p1_GENE_NODE_849_length_2511_cov_19_475324_g670_i0NODE_849_length_2511_cov_19_475324_g670_i0_p1_ORF_typecomplete_len548_score43_94Rft1/PF04506_13/2_5e45_NODE_849_length_2511_cov_19_475324_g670_i01541797
MSVPSVATTTKSLFGKAALPRLVNIGINFLTVQLAPLEWYGLHSINLMFFVTITEWLRIQCFRRQLLRNNKTEASLELQRNLCRISFLTSVVIISLVLIQYWVRVPVLVLNSPQSLPYYYQTLLLHSLAATVSAFGEYPYLALCKTANHSRRLNIESSCSLIHTSVFAGTLVVARYLHAELSSGVLLASGLAQLAWALSTLVAMMWCSGIRFTEAWGFQVGIPRVLKEKPGLWIDQECREQLNVDFIQAIQKGFISEADKLLMMRYFSDQSKGALALVSNMGGFILRLLFQPQEDMLSVHYSNSQRPDGKTYGDLYRWLSVFRTVSLSQVTVGSAAAVFGPLYAEAALCLVYGPRLRGHYVLLGRYSMLILLYALNGILEGMLVACGGSRWQKRHLQISRIFWLVSILGSVLVWELVPNADDLLVWLLSTGLSLSGRLIAPAQFLLETVRGSDRVKDRMDLLVHDGSLRILWTLVIGFTGSHILMRALQFTDEFAMYVPTRFQSRFLVSQLLSGAICAGLLLLNIFKALDAEDNYITSPTTGHMKQT